MTIATNMAGGTDIILGGNSDYTARLVGEVLLVRSVKPEEITADPAAVLQADSLMIRRPRIPAAVRACIPVPSLIRPIKPSGSWCVIWSRLGAIVPSR